MQQIARMRTIPQCVEYFKKEDPDTQVGTYYLTQLVKSGKFSVVKSGRKNLINLDRLIEYLNAGQAEEAEEVKQIGIRKVF